MPLDPLHGRIASVALRAAARFGFALGGGNALVAHGVIDRLTRDVDLVTDRETGVLAAKGPVEEALRREGFAVQRRDGANGVVDLFPDWEEASADWHVTAPNGRRTDLEMVHFDRSREPVLMDVGPVLHLEDAAGNKVCALVSRVEPRDYVDTAALLGRWNSARLIGFARRLDPGLKDREYAAAAQRLDRMPDEKFTPFGLTGQAVAALRERFAAWPRDARVVSRLRGSSRNIGDSTAARNGREKLGQAGGQLPDREVSGRTGQTAVKRDQDRAIRSLDRQRKELRERGRDDEWEIGR
jgi:Nucleotidyl transferase AbiEii toxin, Type IV TA system